MKALGIIAGIVAGLSVAHAAEKDDLVSAFEAACMGNEPFIETVRNFANSHGWHVQVRESKQDPKLTARMGLAIATPSVQKLMGTLGPGDTFIMIIAGNGVGGPRGIVNSCKVAQIGTSSLEEIADQLDHVLGVSIPSEPLSSEIREYLVPEGLGPDAKQWVLSSSYADYVILSAVIWSDAQRSERVASLERLRAPLKGRP